MRTEQARYMALAVVICGGGFLSAQDSQTGSNFKPPVQANDTHEIRHHVEKGAIGSEVRMQSREFSGKIEKPVGPLPSGLQGSVKRKDAKMPDGHGYSDVVTIDAAHSAEFIGASESGLHSSMLERANALPSSTSDPRAQLISPENGAVLPPVQTFSWTKGTSVTGYYLWIGSCSHCNDLLSEGEGLNLSRTVTLPNDGRIIYFTLFSYINAKWYYVDYQFYSLDGAVPSYISSPGNGATLGSPQTLSWTPGTKVSDHYLWVGNCHDCTDLLDEEEGSGTSRTITLPLDGRTIFVTLFSYIEDRWYYYDYQFRAGPGGAQLVTTTNRLGYALNVFVNGASVGSVDAFQTHSFDVRVDSLLVSFELVRPALSGVSLGDPMSGYFSRIDNPSGTYNFVVTNKIGADLYFLPEITNQTPSPLEIEVNGGLDAENKCNCEAPAYSTNVAAGYYHLYSNSNVRLFLPGHNYSGPYIFWGEDANGVVSTGGLLYPFVQADSGILNLTATFVPY